jgi:hypothetical protein
MNEQQQEHLKVGDKVIDFRGEETGVVTHVSGDRGRKSRLVVVNGREYYERVWQKVDEPGMRPVEEING